MTTNNSFQWGVRCGLAAVHTNGIQDIEKVSWRSGRLALETYKEKGLNFCRFIQNLHNEREQNPAFDNCMSKYFGFSDDKDDQEEFINGFISVINEMIDQSEEGTGREE